MADGVFFQFQMRMKRIAGSMVKIWLMVAGFMVMNTWRMVSLHFIYICC